MRSAESDGQPAARLEQPELFVDPNLDRVLESITTGREQYELGPVFCAPLCEVAAVRYRHKSSEIARPLVRAMPDTPIRGFFVTHTYDLAHGFHAHLADTALFLRAHREPDGRRTFRLTEQALPTIYGRDADQRIFGETAVAAARRS